jgi:hypothetical protein
MANIFASSSDQKEMAPFFNDGRNHVYSWLLVRRQTIPTEQQHLSVKLMPTFAVIGVSRGQRNGSPRPLYFFFHTWATKFSVE